MALSLLATVVAPSTMDTWGCCESQEAPQKTPTQEPALWLGQQAKALHVSQYPILESQCLSQLLSFGCLPMP